MAEAIFLSASVPDPKRAPQYAATADTVAIASAVNSLAHVTLGPSYSHMGRTSRRLHQ